MLIRFLLPFFLFINLTCCPKQDISVTAKSAILISPLTKRIAYSKDIHQKLPPASTTKILTALVVLENSHLEKKVKVSRFASSMEPSKIHIKEGELYYTEDLLKGILLNSGNDASVALAESVAGSEARFAVLMNETARRLGAKDTNFKNSNGLPAQGQYSTVYDLSLIVREAMRSKKLVEIMNTKTSEIKEINSGRKIKLKNHNKSLWKERPYVILGKTGYTKKARHCFAGYIQYNRWKKAIVVVLGGGRVWPDLDVLAESLL